MFLRPATMDDALSVLEWRNDETTRNNSFTKAIISKEDHLNWFKRKIEDGNCLMFILEDDGRAVGNVRLDITDDIGEISYMIAPDERGKGLGKKALELLRDTKEVSSMVDSQKLRSLVGFVNEGNIASAKCFEDNGYSRINAGDIRCYIKNL